MPYLEVEGIFSQDPSMGPQVSFISLLCELDRYGTVWHRNECDNVF